MSGTTCAQVWWVWRTMVGLRGSCGAHNVAMQTMLGTGASNVAARDRERGRGRSCELWKHAGADGTCRSHRIGHCA